MERITADCAYFLAVMADFLLIRRLRNNDLRIALDFHFRYVQSAAELHERFYIDDADHIYQGDGFCGRNDDSGSAHLVAREHRVYIYLLIVQLTANIRYFLPGWI